VAIAKLLWSFVSYNYFGDCTCCFSMSISQYSVNIGSFFHTISSSLNVYSSAVEGVLFSGRLVIVPILQRSIALAAAAAAVMLSHDDLNATSYFFGHRRGGGHSSMSAVKLCLKFEIAVYAWITDFIKTIRFARMSCGLLRLMIPGVCKTVSHVTLCKPS